MAARNQEASADVTPQNRGHEFQNRVQEVLKNLFLFNVSKPEDRQNPQLELIQPEKYKNNESGYRVTEDRYRLDALYRIKQDSNRLYSFWNTLLHTFQSLYVVIECKSYQDGVPEEQVLLTEKYLYPKAKRSVCILFSDYELSPDAKRACRSALRDQGKLILPIEKVELEKLEQYGSVNDEMFASTYLQERLDLFLLSIGR
jgi:hypothetical protein